MFGNPGVILHLCTIVGCSSYKLVFWDFRRVLCSVTFGPSLAWLCVMRHRHGSSCDLTPSAWWFRWTSIQTLGLWSGITDAGSRCRACLQSASSFALGHHAWGESPRLHRPVFRLLLGIGPWETFADQRWGSHWESWGLLEWSSDMPLRDADDAATLSTCLKDGNLKGWSSTFRVFWQKQSAIQEGSMAQGKNRNK